MTPIQKKNKKDLIKQLLEKNFDESIVVKKKFLSEKKKYSKFKSNL